jgi:hypothetical protein
MRLLFHFGITQRCPLLTRAIRVFCHFTEMSSVNRLSGGFTDVYFRCTKSPLKSKIMKKITCLFTAAFALLSSAHAQKPRMGITIGNTVSSYKFIVESVSVAAKPRIGYTVGLVADIPVGRHLSLSPALNYVQKGGRLKSDDTKSVLITNYLELPLNLVYKIPASSGNFLVGAGASISAGVNGKDKWESQGESGSNKVKFGSGDDKDFKSIETGINFMTGFIAGDGFIITANYNLGLTNALNHLEDYDASFRNRYFALRVGYMLSK